MTERAPYGEAHNEFLRLSANETDECVLWPYSQNGHGYGHVYLQGRMVLTHRLSCLRAHGKPPSPKHTDAAHSCRNRACFNPRHLRWATRAENLSDMVGDGTDPAGERHGGSRLVEDDIRTIRSHSLADIRVVGAWYSVHYEHIRAIITRKKWAHV